MCLALCAYELQRSVITESELSDAKPLNLRPFGENHSSGKNTASLKNMSDSGELYTSVLRI